MIRIQPGFDENFNKNVKLIKISILAIFTLVILGTAGRFVMGCLAKPTGSAEGWMDRYVGNTGQTYSVDCRRWDTDGDGYSSCTGFVYPPAGEKGETKTVHLNCNVFDGCKEKLFVPTLNGTRKP